MPLNQLWNLKSVDQQAIVDSRQLNRAGSEPSIGDGDATIALVEQFAGDDVFHGLIADVVGVSLGLNCDPASPAGDNEAGRISIADDAFRYPDPRDPYNSGLSPLRACFEEVSLISDYAAFKQAKFQNRAIPDAIVSPDEVIGEEERDRLEEQWNRKFRKGGAGRILVGETGLKVQLLSQSMGDVAAMAEMGKTKEDVANAFHVPLAFLTTQTNLANLQAAEHQHMTKAIGPRLQRRDEKLNEQLIPIYDPTRRLFLTSEDPTPADPEQTWETLRINMEFGIITINEARDAQGLPPVPWGAKPWLPSNQVQPE